MLLTGNLCHSDLRGESQEQVTAVAAARSALPGVSIKKKKRYQRNPGPQLTAFEENTGAGNHRIFFSALCKICVHMYIYTHKYTHA